MSRSADVLEEYFDDEPTGVEREEDVDALITEPWDPDLIRVNSKSFALRNVLDMIRDEELDLAPDFQRQQVWKAYQKSRLIESILLQIPLPSFYFTEETDGVMRVVDGLQRLSTIEQFCRVDEGGFRLNGLEYLHDVEGLRFGELAPSWQRRLRNTQLFVHVIDPQTPDPVKFDIFKRINTGGSPLNAQEIRHCMSGRAARAFLKASVALPEFQRATGGALQNHIRMVDREVALRFYAFYMLVDVEEYRDSVTMDAFLTEATRVIDGLSDAERETLIAAFKMAMSNAYKLFGEHAFRKWPLDDERRSPINRALFESWAVALASFTWSQLKPHADKIVRRARELMTKDRGYVAAISVSTGDPNRVELRFNRAREILAASTR